MCLTTTGQNKKDQNIDTHWVCIICFDSCSLARSPPYANPYITHTLGGKSVII